MEFRSIGPEDYELIRQFLSKAGWSERVGDREQFSKMMSNTNRAVVAWEDSRVVGFGRALCDEVSNGYISMVAVDVKYRKRGIGRELVERLIGDSRGITWVLRAGRGSKAFWEKVGFKESDIAMERTNVQREIGIS